MHLPMEQGHQKKWLRQQWARSQAYLYSKKQDLVRDWQPPVGWKPVDQKMEPLSQQHQQLVKD